MAKIKGITAFRPKDFSPIIGLQKGLTDPYINMGMGQTAEIIANQYGISRESQDAFAVDSHLKAAARIEELKQEIFPYPLGGKSIGTDNGIRTDSSTEKLSKLRPVFDRKTGSG